MKAIIDRNALATALKDAAGVAAKKSTTLALRCALIRATVDGIWIEANDIDKGIRIPVGGKVEKEGEAIVPAELAARVVERLPKYNEDGDQVAVTVSDEGSACLHVEAVGVTADIEGFDDVRASDFPSILWAAGDTPRAVLDAEAFSDLLAATLPAVSADDGRTAICGVCIETDASRVRAIATDGRRLHVAEAAECTVPAERQCVIVSRRHAKWLARRLADAAGNIAVVFAKGAIEAHLPTGEAYMTRLVEAVFPEWRKVVPEEEGVGAVVKSYELCAACTRAAVLGEAAAMWLSPEGDDEIAISTVSKLGKIAERVDAAAARAIGKTPLSAAYLLDALRAVGGVCATMRGSGEAMSPVSIRSDNGLRFAVVMPLRA